MFQVFTGIVALSSLLSFLNKKFLKLPDTIGVMILAIITSFFVGSIYFIDESTFRNICSVVHEIDFRTILFDFLLSFLLFAGSIHVDLPNLMKEKWSVLIFASFGVLVSTFIVGTSFYYLANFLGIEINYAYSLVFGALISPTDPIAVLALLKRAGTPKDMEIKIIGESLFNDGVGIVVFITLLSVASVEGGELHISHVLREFGQEAFGGILMGFALGNLGKVFLKSISKSPIIAVHITIAIVMGGYSLSSLFHVSGALAMVVAGLIIGDYLHNHCDNPALKKDMNSFWTVLDEIFNAVLFVLIGIEILSLEPNINYTIIGVIAIPLILASRYVTLFISNALLKKRHRNNHRKIAVFTWAGLRGGISIALALTLPESEFREVILFVTYAVVVFSILVQGLTIEKLVKKLLKQ